MKPKKKNRPFSSSVLLSLGLHLIFIIFMVFGRCDNQTWIPQQTVYQVELVSQAIQTPQKPVAQPIPAESEPVIEQTEEREPPEPKIEPIPEKPVEIPEPQTKTKEPAKKSPASSKTVEPVTETTPSDSGASGENRLTIDTENFPFVYYVNLLQNRIKQNWQPPPNMRKKLSAVIGFNVQRNGKFRDIVVEKSSGQFLFDQAAQRAIHYAGPMPPLPNQFLENQLSVHIEFEGL